jgi:uncharacterized membrane protein YkvA (DUF1232 family)
MKTADTTTGGSRLPGLKERWQRRARGLQQETYALYLACRNPRVPWYVRLLAVGVVAYAFSPIDLIPDFIPVLGHLDDLVVIPLGVRLVRRLIPSTVLADCRQRAQALMGQGRPTNWVAAAIIITVWLLLAGLFIHMLLGLRKH